MNKSRKTDDGKIANRIRIYKIQLIRVDRQFRCTVGQHIWTVGSDDLNFVNLFNIINIFWSFWDHFVHLDCKYLKKKKKKKKKHYENTPIQIHRNFTSKNWKFLDKNLWHFSYFCSKHRFWVLLEQVSTMYVLEQTYIKNNVYMYPCKTPVYDI